MTSYVVRPIVVIPIAEASNTSDARPEKTVLTLYSRASLLAIDVGAYCYLSREPVLKGGIKKASQARGVVLQSFSEVRAEFIKKLIEHLGDEARLSLRSSRTLESCIRGYLRFLDWADAAGYGENIGKYDATKIAFLEYSESLRDDVRQNKLSQNSASLYQRLAQQMLDCVLGADDIGAGIRTIRSSMAARKETSPPDEGNQGHVLSLCTIIFDRFADVVLQGGLFPFKLQFSDGLTHDKALWVFPTNNKFVSSFDKPNGIVGRHENCAYDYGSGRVRTIAEIRKHEPHCRNPYSSLFNAQRNLSAVNTDLQHHQRRRLALIAHHAFALLFVANTGMNWAQVAALPWEELHEVAGDSQGFRSIKYRAGNRPVSFRIAVGFLPLFRRFLELRDFLLDGHRSSTLFFMFGVNLKSTPKPLTSHAFVAVFRLLARIEPNIKPITPREWRAAKADWLVRTTDVSLAAEILQNSEKTVLRHYIAGSEMQAANEMGEYFERLSRVVVDEAQSLDATNALGGCRKFGTPAFDSSATLPVTPNCKETAGCLFCDNFAVHADAIDVRKLLSCSHCIRVTESISGSQEQFLSVYGAILNRIDAIVMLIGTKSENNLEMISRVRIEVDEDGCLDPYWEQKMSMLISLGVVTA